MIHQNRLKKHGWTYALNKSHEIHKAKPALYNVAKSDLLMGVVLLTRNGQWRCRVRKYEDISKQKTSQNNPTDPWRYIKGLGYSVTVLLST